MYRFYTKLFKVTTGCLSIRVMATAATENQTSKTEQVNEDKEVIPTIIPRDGWLTMYK